VAYRYFATPQRKFIIADAPGHEQYTRNMVTAAAGSDAAMVLVDITKIDWARAYDPLLPPAAASSCRRRAATALLAHLLRVPSIVFAVNKIDAVDDPQPAFEAVSIALQAFAREAGIKLAASCRCRRCAATTSHGRCQPPGTGPQLLQLLQACRPRRNASTAAAAAGAVRGARLWRTADGTGHQPRTLWGRIAHGRCQARRRGAGVPQRRARHGGALRRAGSDVIRVAGQSAGADARPPARCLARRLGRHTRDAAAGAALRRHAGLAGHRTRHAGPQVLVRHGNRWVQARIASIGHRLDIHTLRRTDAHELAVNDIGDVVVELQQPLPLEPYAHNRVGGSLIVVDPASNRTSGALLVNVVR
jgi:sulfate adenylyltransferase subunit 1